jgi:hypothetical protein
MAVDSFSSSSEDVLNDLDPLSRALLDLSLQRDMDDAEIADVLGTDEESVFEVRVGLLRALAEKVAPEHADADVTELQAVIADRLYSDRAAEVEEIAELEAAVPVAVAAPEPSSPAPAEAAKRRSPLRVVIPLLILVAAVAAVVLLAAGGDDDNASPPATPPSKVKPQSATQAKPDAVRLTAVGGGNAGGTVALDGDRVKLTLHGLPNAQAGSYQVWAYNSVIDAKPLGSAKDARLPGNARSYKYLDVSLEPADGNANHSGQSVLRVPMKKLAR